MGNSSLYGVRRHSRQLGSYAAVDVRKTEYKKKGVRRWNVLLTVDGSNSELDLNCFLDTDGKVHSVIFELSGDIWSGGCIKFLVSKAKTDLLKLTPLEISFLRQDFISHLRSFSTVNTQGCVTESTAYVYECGRKGGLLVTELKKKSEHEEPYKLTVAHYYAVAESGNLFSLNEKDIGLSVIAKIGVATDVGLDIMVEQGPEEHPAAALFYMFEEITKTGRFWKPTLCPHCANIQRQLGAGMSSQSESEDNDNFPPPRHGQNAQSTINNSGRIRGNGNGCFISVKRVNFR